MIFFAVIIITIIWWLLVVSLLIFFPLMILMIFFPLMILMMFFSCLLLFPWMFISISAILILDRCLNKTIIHIWWSHQWISSTALNSHIWIVIIWEIHRINIDCVTLRLFTRLLFILHHWTHYIYWILWSRVHYLRLSFHRYFCTSGRNIIKITYLFCTLWLEALFFYRIHCHCVICHIQWVRFLHVHHHWTHAIKVSTHLWTRIALNQIPIQVIMGYYCLCLLSKGCCY